MEGVEPASRCCRNQLASQEETEGTEPSLNSPPYDSEPPRRRLFERAESFVGCGRKCPASRRPIIVAADVSRR